MKQLCNICFKPASVSLDVDRCEACWSRDILLPIPLFELFEFPFSRINYEDEFWRKFTATDPIEDDFWLSMKPFWKAKRNANS